MTFAEILKRVAQALRPMMVGGLFCCARFSMSKEAHMSAKFVIGLSAVLVIVVCMVAVSLAFVGLPKTASNVPSPTPAAITRLTQGPATELRPAWSPDNRWIAFESNLGSDTFHIYVMKPDGSELRVLTSGTSDDRRPVWTPDGKAILYDSSDGTHEEIWMVNFADGSRKQLTHTDGLASYASLSPDGKHMAFYVYKDGTLDLWTARADGSDAHALTRELASTENNQCTFACHQAGWSLDSQNLVYTGGDGKTIWMMRADGSNPQCVIADGETNHFPWFLPDGRLAFITEYVPPDYGGAWTNAWAYDLKTGERTLIQEFMSMQGPIDWNADYSQVVFHSPRAGNFDTYLINLKAPGGLGALQGTPVPTEPAQSK
jgi:Tol biopolymer transport system component